MRVANSLCSTGLMFAAFLGGDPVSARQTDAPKAKTEQQPTRPAGRPGFGPPIVSPEVQPDRHVTFRLRAPGAKEVTVSGEWGGGPKAMARDEQGTFSLTVGPLAADIYGYSFSVDGFQTLDPGNPALKPMRSLRTSILEVPGDPPRLHEFQDVPHGTIRVHEYRSRSLGGAVGSTSTRRQAMTSTPRCVFPCSTSCTAPATMMPPGPCSGTRIRFWTICSRRAK